MVHAGKIGSKDDDVNAGQPAPAWPPDSANDSPSPCGQSLQSSRRRWIRTTRERGGIKKLKLAPKVLCRWQCFTLTTKMATRGEDLAFSALN